jgi:hypothetical protein
VKRVVVTLIFAAASTGCVVKVPQYDAARGFVGQFVSRDSDRSEQLFLWTARIGDEGRLLRLYEEQGFFIFASEEGDAVAFDGWQVRSLVGFGLDGLHQFAGTGPRYRLSAAGRIQQLLCSEWLRSRSAAGTVVWEQQCDALPVNRIELDRLGDIARMQFVIDTEGRVMELERLTAKVGQ